MVASISCPACSEPTEASECPSCGVDLSSLLEVRRAAYKCARESVRLARHHQIKLAAVHAEKGMRLCLDEDLRPIFAWIHFLDGQLSVAVQCWNDVPERAEGILECFNNAFRLARGNDWPEALEELEEIALPFRPALILEFICADRAGDEALVDNLRRTLKNSFPDVSLPDQEAPEQAERRTPQREVSGWGPIRSSGAILAGTILVAGAFGLGYLFQGGASGGLSSSDGSKAENTTSASVPPSPTSGDNSSQHGVLADSLKVGWAYLRRDPGPVAEAVEGAVGARPVELVRDVPRDVRHRIARVWYLDGLDRINSGQANNATRYFRASLASVGSASGDYWVDDALYVLARALEDGGSASAPDWARQLLIHHDTSMYANSRVRSIAADTGSHTP